MAFIEGGEIQTSMFRENGRSPLFWCWIREIVFPIAKRDFLVTALEEPLSYLPDIDSLDNIPKEVIKDAIMQATNFSSRSLKTRREKLQAVFSLTERMVPFLENQQETPYVMPISGIVVILPHLVNQQALNTTVASLMLKQTEQMVKIASEIGGTIGADLTNYVNSSPKIPCDFTSSLTRRNY